jgi:hypothetical protein
MADTQPALKEEADAAQLKSPPEDILAAAAAEEDDNDEDEPDAKRSKKKGPLKTRAMRLEQNRKAARESRKRKKVLVEELQRSVIFFSRANGTLRSQNEEMEQMLLSVQAQLQAGSGLGGMAPNLASVVSSPWAMVAQQGLQPQGAPAPPAAAQQDKSPAPNGAAPIAAQQQQQQQGIDNNLLANWMNLQAAMGGAGVNPGMMPFMGGIPGMMPFGFPGFMPQQQSSNQGQQQSGVNNPLVNMGPSPGTSNQSSS